MKISVFTPTFNSTATLKRAYESLEKQKYKNFEWIIVDDLSTDNGATKELINQLTIKASFPCKSFFLKENHFGGKSMEKALEYATGDIFVLLDHDDEVYADSFERVVLLARKYFSIPNIAGVVGRCVNEEGVLIGKKFPKEQIVDYEGHLRYTKNIFSEFVTYFKTSILKEKAGIMKRGFTYGVLMAKISNTHKMVFVNEVFRIYDVSVPTSYTNTKSLNTKFPSEQVEMNLIVFEFYKKYFLWQPLLTFKQLVHNNYLIIKYKIKADFIQDVSFFVSILLFITKPLGFLKYKLKG